MKDIDVPLLRKQRNFLLEYPWTEEFPEEIDGIINLLDHILDVEEGGKRMNQIEECFTCGEFLEAEEGCIVDGHLMCEECDITGKMQSALKETSA